MAFKRRRIWRKKGYIPAKERAEDFRDLLHRILHYANRSASRVDFLLEVAKILTDFTDCDAVELRVRESESYFRSCEAVRRPKRSFISEVIPMTKTASRALIPDAGSDAGLLRVCEDLLSGARRLDRQWFTRGGSFWTNDTTRPLTLVEKAEKSEEPKRRKDLRIGGRCRSLAVLPLIIENEAFGLLLLKSRRKEFFTEEILEFYEDVAQSFGIGLAYHLTKAGLNERVKELTCLYGIARVAERRDLSLERVLESIVSHLPPAWQHPDIASARIVLDDYSYPTPGFKGGLRKQRADIVVDDKPRGFVEVVYSESTPELDEGPFLKEERRLIDTVAREITLIIKQRQADEASAKLQVQLRHADRLATIGQLAAGVAHELNEPLGNILGFAQLIQKAQGLPHQAASDIDKIIAASLHAREVIKKLMFFARQMPPRKTRVSLNKVVQDGLYFLTSRCTRAGVELELYLAEKLPEITADAGQLHQALVNLVVNAVQSMPEGGKLKIRTFSEDGSVFLSVADTGIGMSQEVLRQIFLPFFTTKDSDQGTGLGLPVVHGIVTAHGGKIRVESKDGEGTKFEIQLPVDEPDGNDKAGSDEAGEP